MSSWKTDNLKNICLIGDGNHSSKYPKKSEMVESGVPFIRGTNIVNGELSSNDVLYISHEKHLQLKKGHLKAGDVLFTNRGEIGKVAIVNEEFAENAKQSTSTEAREAASMRKRRRSSHYNLATSFKQGDSVQQAR